jgi:hypothetical protein
MVNEAMPWNLTVQQLSEFLARCQPDAIVRTTITRDMVEQLDAITSNAPDMTLYLGLEIASDPNRGVVNLGIKVGPPDERPDELARQLLSSGRSPIEAIKAVRVRLGMSLGEAKAVVHRNLSTEQQHAAEALWDQAERAGDLDTDE